MPDQIRGKTRSRKGIDIGIGAVPSSTSWEHKGSKRKKTEHSLDFLKAILKTNINNEQEP
ncbi:MAG: hypothetical protein CMH54_02905 [Myxococcales bacterium]|nr:hypothetical protein [Myxococcales bacterium]